MCGYRLRTRVFAFGLLVLVVTQSGCSWLRRFGRDEAALTVQAKPVPLGASSVDDRASAGATASDRGPSTRRRWPGLLGRKANRKRRSGSGEVRNDDPDESIRLAEQALRQQRISEAVGYVTAALEIDPEHAGAWLLKGKIEEAVGRREPALEAYHRAVSCEGSQPEASLSLARLQIEEGQAARSAPVLRAILDCSQATDDQKAQATWLLGIAYAHTQRWSYAVPALVEGASKREMTPNDWYWLALARYKTGDIAGAAHDLEPLLKTDPGNDKFGALLAEIKMVQEPPDEILPAQNLAMPEEPRRRQ